MGFVFWCNIRREPVKKAHILSRVAHKISKSVAWNYLSIKFLSFILTISIAKFVRWSQLQRTLPSPNTRSSVQPSCDQLPRPKFQYEHKVALASPRAIVCKVIFTGLPKFFIGNPLILPAITKLFKRLDALVVSSKEAAKNFVSL